MDKSNTPNAPTIPRRTPVKRMERYESTMSPPADLQRKAPVVWRLHSPPQTPLTTAISPNKNLMPASGSDLDDVATRATEGTSLSTLSSTSSIRYPSINSEDACFQPHISESSINNSQEQQQQQQEQQVRRIKSLDMRVSRSQARRARRNNNNHGQRSISPTGCPASSVTTAIPPTAIPPRRTTSLSPSIPPRNKLSWSFRSGGDQFASSIRTEGDPVRLAPGSVIEQEEGEQAVAFPPHSEESSIDNNSLQPQQQQQVRRIKSLDMRVNRSLARRARRNNNIRSISPTGIPTSPVTTTVAPPRRTTSLSPTIPPRNQLSRSVRSEGTHQLPFPPEGGEQPNTSSTPDLILIEQEEDEAALFPPHSEEPSDNNNSSPQPQVQQQPQQVRRIQSLDMRVNRSLARRARRNNNSGRSTSPTGTPTSPVTTTANNTPPRRTTSLSPTIPPRNQQLSRSVRSEGNELASSVRTEGGLVMLAPDLLIEQEEENETAAAVGDDLVGRATTLVSRARDSTASARSRDSNVVESAMEQPPREYRRRIDIPEKEERPSLLSSDDADRPGAFAVPRRAFGGVPAWFEEARERRRQQQQQEGGGGGCTTTRAMRRGSSARSNSSGGGSSRRLSLRRSLRANSLQVFGRLYESNRTNGSMGNDDDEQEGGRGGNDEETTKRKSGVARRISMRRWSSIRDWSSMLEASCTNLVAHGSQVGMDYDHDEDDDDDDDIEEVELEKEEEEEEKGAASSTHRDSTLKVPLSMAPLVRIVTTPIQLLRKKNKKQLRRSKSVEY